MPLPKPKNKEKKSEFVSRCIGDTQTGKDFPDQKQRIAVCYSLWDQEKAKAEVVAGEGDNEFLYSAQKTYSGKKRSELNDSDFLFPETRSFPIVSPQDVRDAINNYGRMDGNMSYDEFIKKLYNKAKSKGSEFVNAIPDSTREKYNLKGSIQDESENQDGFTEELNEIEASEGSKKLNKPFRTPNGPKKFSVYVKNDKGNIVKVNFGDPSMEIKRDDPERRKNYRARHNCDNPGPKWKANFWSCKMWSSKPVSAIASEDEAPEEELMDLKEDLSEMVIGSLGAIKSFSENILNNLSNEFVKENLSEPFLQQMAALAEDYVTTIHNYVMFSQEPEEEMEEVEAGKRKGLWDNIRDKKKRMGKNYKPAQSSSPDRPSQDSWKKAQE